MNVLIVEDDAGIGRFLNRGLAAEGYGVEWLKDGKHAREKLGSGVFSAAIVDLGLPDVDGTDLCRAIRSAGIDTPICVITARAALEDKLEGFAAGADDYLTKPFAFEELLVRLAAITRRREAARDRLITFGTLTIDPVARIAAIGTQRLELSDREFKVLLCLGEQAGETVSRAALISRVWSGDMVTDNAVDVYVSYVRRKLRQHPDAPAIITQRGRGFSLSRSIDAG